MVSGRAEAIPRPGDCASPSLTAQLLLQRKDKGSVEKELSTGMVDDR